MPGLIVPHRTEHPSIPTPPPLRVLPWITDGATSFLDAEIGDIRASGREIHALECGSGSSTVYLGQRVTRLVSFEHDMQWHAKMRSVMSGIGYSNVEWRTEARPYSRLFDEYTQGEFDIALIDGRDRVSCVDLSRRLLKPGGVMVVDNTERITGLGDKGPYYDILRLLQGWPAIHFEQQGKDHAGWVPPHRWITSVWRKPDPEYGTTHSTSAGHPL